MAACRRNCWISRHFSGDRPTDPPQRKGRLASLTRRGGRAAALCPRYVHGRRYVHGTPTVCRRYVHGTPTVCRGGRNVGETEGGDGTPTVPGTEKRDTQPSRAGAGFAWLSSCQSRGDGLPGPSKRRPNRCPADHGCPDLALIGLLNADGGCPRSEPGPNGGEPVFGGCPGLGRLRIRWVSRFGGAGFGGCPGFGRLSGMRLFFGFRGLHMVIFRAELTGASVASP
jgi:hypothetical protein